MVDEFKAMTSRRSRLIWLWLLTLLFLLRVIGQLLVVCCRVSWLPPMSHWYSGLLPYPILFPTQLIILALQTKINIDWAEQVRWFARPHHRFGNGLQWFSYGYASVMAVRYVLTMTVYPERRWFGEGTIPIIFHVVLAAYVYLWGQAHR
ncbi:MAG: hypothetical protein AAF327_05485 [Cyanobacteria bacterium P01_A01_bin.37]